MPKRRSNTISTEANRGSGAIGASGSGISPYFQSRNRICRHMNAVNNAIGAAEEEISSMDASEVMSARIQQDIRDEIQRSQEGPSQDDGFFMEKI